MAFSMIYSKTDRGSAEVRSRSNALTPVARRVLIMIDGRRTEDELAQVVRDGELDGILATLRSHGMIEEVGFADLPEPVWDADDDDDTVLIEPPTVRVDLGMAIATAAPPPPPTLHAAVTPAAAAAARPLAPSNAATPARLAVPVERRSPPAPSMQAAAVAAVAPAKPATAHAATGVAPASAAAPARTPILARVFAPEKSGAPAQSSPAPEPPPPPGLEETKKLAVRALFERLGPYGEAPAARIQDCKTLEALQEQLKHAYQRIITFRGESAAREYLASIGMA